MKTSSIHFRRTGQVQIVLPTEISRALQEKGYNRVRIEVDENGIHLHPYKYEGFVLPEFKDD